MSIVTAASPSLTGWSAWLTAEKTTRSSSQMIHPWKLTWKPKVTQLKRNIIFQTSILEFHVSFPAFQSTHVFPHPTETTPGEISVTWTHALSKVFSLSKHTPLVGKIFSKQKSWRRFVYYQVTKCLKTYFGKFFWNRSPIPKLPPLGDFWWWQQYSCEKVCSKKIQPPPTLAPTMCLFWRNTRQVRTGRPYPTQIKKFRPRRHKLLLNVKE